MFTPCFSISIIHFEHAIAGWEWSYNAMRLTWERRSNMILHWNLESLDFVAYNLQSLGILCQYWCLGHLAQDTIGMKIKNVNDVYQFPAQDMRFWKITHSHRIIQLHLTVWKELCLICYAKASSKPIRIIYINNSS